MVKPVFMKLDTCIMAPLSISTGYLTNPSISISVYMCILLPLLGDGSAKIPLSLIGNGSVKTLPRHEFTPNNRIIL
jgi:hypothetical protein